MTTRRMRKADIDFHADYGPAHPAVNVKAHDAYQWERQVPIVASDNAEPGFTVDWIEAHAKAEGRDVDEMVNGWFDVACESEREYLVDQATEYYGWAVEYHGRSGGWAVVPAFDRDDVEGWDAIAVAKWGRFAKLARDIADGVTYQLVALILFNEYEAAREAAEREVERRRALDAANEHWAELA